MERRTLATTDRRRNQVFRALANRRRRQVLSVLDRIGPAAIPAVASHVVAFECGCSLLDVSRRDTRAVERALEHVHLPRLTAADLLRRSGDVLQRTDHPALEDPAIETIVETDTERWDAVVACLADHRRRRVLWRLSRTETSIDRLTLATDLAERAFGPTAAAGSVKPILQELHHTHLPKLEAAGLAAYDADTKTITYEGHPTLDEQWLAPAASGTAASILATGEAAADVWTLEGRDAVSDRVSEIVAATSEELIVVTGAAASESDRPKQIRDAVDSDVAVYLGVRNRHRREFGRERVPEAVVWTPELDWFDRSAAEESVDCLILADREAAALVTVAEQDADAASDTAAASTRSAITGAGRNNPLVSLLTETLGSSVDQLAARDTQDRAELTA